MQKAVRTIKNSLLLPGAPKRTELLLFSNFVAEKKY
jgi:hypothetical protein